MKKLLSLVLALLMVLGCMSITAFAEVSYTLDLGGAQVVYAIMSLPTESKDTAIQGWTDQLYGTLVDESSLSVLNVDNWSAYYEAYENLLSAVKFTGSEGNFSYTHSGMEIQSILVLALTDSTVLAPGASYVVYYGTCAKEGGAITLEDSPIATGKLCTDAPAEEGKSGSTNITATKEEPFSYEIVIPTNVAEITNFGVYEVGQAKVTGVTGATENTVISYTATTTDFKAEDKSDIPATYYTEQTAINTFPTTAVTVYENKADAASIPTMWVKIAESDWNAADAGTYHATVTFNFAAEEKKSTCEVDTETNTLLYRVAKIDDENAILVVYNSYDGFDAIWAAGMSMPKNLIREFLGSECAVGDCFHVLEDESLKKCIAPETHGLYNEVVICSIELAGGYSASPFVVPAGATYSIDGNKLCVHYGEKQHYVGGGECSWTLNDLNLSNGDTGTISDGDAFVGTSLPN